MTTPRRAVCTIRENKGRRTRIESKIAGVTIYYENLFPAKAPLPSKVSPFAPALYEEAGDDPTFLKAILHNRKWPSGRSVNVLAPTSQDSIAYSLLFSVRRRLRTGK
jgi:hypothetical protein